MTPGLWAPDDTPAPKLYPCQVATCFCVDTAPTPPPGEHPLIPDLKIPLLSLPAFYSGILKDTERKCMHACVHMKNASVPVLSLSWMNLVQEDLVSGDYLWSLFSISKNRKKSDYLFFRLKKQSVCAGMSYFGYNVCSTRSVKDHLLSTYHHCWC